MFLVKSRLVIALALCLSFAPVAAARQGADPAPKGKSWVEEKALKAKIFEVKNRDPRALSTVLKGLSSGIGNSDISFSEEFKTITVRDYPENLVVIEEAIKRLDTPEPPHAASPDVGIHIHVLVASNAAGAAEDFPAELNDVIKQLQSTLRYKSYSLMTSEVHRTKTFGGEVSNSGVVDSKVFNLFNPQASPIMYDYIAKRIMLGVASSGGASVDIGNFQFTMRIPIDLSGNGSKIQYQNVGFTSPLNVRDGEKVVVGTTTMGDKALIVVLSVKLLK